ncbi:hypothetical protein RUM44_009476 [Polyplax serrata]|uniref:Uncharacterized protein n=1 Tax=Polyplax serrata TaxID=468196 RepID=A0ABR1ASS9_POLSC
MDVWKCTQFGNLEIKNPFKQFPFFPVSLFWHHKLFGFSTSRIFVPVPGKFPKKSSRVPGQGYPLTKRPGNGQRNRTPGKGSGNKSEKLVKLQGETVKEYDICRNEEGKVEGWH